MATTSSTAAHADDHAHDSHGSHGHGHGHGEFSHPAPVWMLLAVFFALLGLTLLTFGDLEIVFSLIIATIKAGLVIAFFMHLLWDKPLNAIVILSSLIFVSLFLGFCLMDAQGYRDNLIMDPNGTILEDSKPKSQLVKKSE
jgi:cytochrome c oxidase subunit IV